MLTDMKTFTQNIAFAIMALFAITLTGCNEDGSISRTLEGTWEGDMYVTSRYSGREYFASYSQVSFLRDPYTFSSGQGYWVDYYDDNYWGGYNYIANHIEWRVDFGTITIYFIEDDYTVKIFNYSLDEYYFSGQLEMTNGNRQNFSMRKVASPNWNNLRYGYDYYGPYYSNTATFDGDSIGTKAGVKTDADFERPQRIFQVRER